MSYILELIDSARFMASSLLNFVINLSEESHKNKCKYRNDDKKCETCWIATIFLFMQTLKVI